MNRPTTRTASALADPSAGALFRVSPRCDGVHRGVLQLVRRFVDALASRRRRSRDLEALRTLGARELRDIGLARRDEATLGERALGRL